MSRFAHVVVVIPGILGTVLMKDGKKIWDLSPAALANAALSGGGHQALALSEQGSQEDDLGDGVVAASMLENIEAVPGLWKLGGYSRLLESLKTVPGLVLNSNLFAFPYDWRRDNRVAARRLARQTKQWLTDWREVSGNSDAKLILIAHSMGGLVASYFADCLDGWRDIHTLINLGVPFRGSANALNFLANGFATGMGWLPGRAAFASMDSVYQLLPTYKFVSNGAAVMKVHEVAIPGIDAGRAKAALDFHEELTAARTRNLAARGQDQGITRAVVGIKQTTGQSAALSSGILTIANTENDGKDLSGDGTVARVATTPVGGTEAASTFIANSHAALPADEGVVNHVLAVLDGTNVDLSDYRVPGLSGAITLHFPQVASTDQPVLIAASPSVPHQYLTAQVRDADGAEVGRYDLYPRDGIYAAEATLPSGLYWVTIGGARARDASDVLVVARNAPHG